MLDGHGGAARRTGWILAVLALCGTLALAWAITPHGAGLSNDSARYLGTARNLAAGRGATSYDGRPLVSHAPLYPALLAVIASATGVDPERAAGVAGAILFGVVVFLAGLLAPRLRGEKGMPGIVVALAALCGPPVAWVCLWAWTEPLFLCEVLGFLLLATHYLARGSRRALAGMSVLAALASLTRYPGIVLLATEALLIGVRERSRPARAAARATLWAGAAALPLVAWLARNVLVAGTPTGPRGPSVFSLGANVRFAARTMLRWVLPPSVAEGLAAYPWLALGLVLGAAVLLVAVAWRRGDTWTRAAVLAAGTFAGLYLAFLLGTASIVGYDQLDDRLLSPLWVPLAVVVTGGLWTLATGGPDAGPRRRLALLACLLLLVVPLARTGKILVRAHRDGLGYAADSWRSSPTVALAAEGGMIGPDTPLYSNAPEALYLLAGRAAKTVPLKRLYNSTGGGTDRGQLAGRWPPEGKALVAWFDRVNWSFMYRPRELAEVSEWRLVRRLADGRIYEVERARRVDQRPPE